MNSVKNYKRKLLWVILSTIHNQTIIGLWLLENGVHWSKF